MKTFLVTVDFESKQYEVKAESKEQAEAKIDQMYDEGEIYTDGYLVNDITESEEA